MNGDALYALQILLFSNIYLITFLTFFENKFDMVDKIYMYSIIVINLVKIYSIALKSYKLIDILHWGYPIYIATAPFFITTLAGKIVYTTLVITQLHLVIYLRRCVISNLKFRKSDYCKPVKRILPTFIPDVVYLLIEVALMVYIWVKK
jgi:hypothetical protein